MANNREADRLWALLHQCSAELSREAKLMGEREPSEHYKRLKADMVKLKREYERAAGTAPYDPNNLKQVEAAGARSFADKMLGQNP